MDNESKTAPTPEEEKLPIWKSGICVLDAIDLARRLLSVCATTETDETEMHELAAFDEMLSRYAESVAKATGQYIGRRRARGR